MRTTVPNPQSLRHRPFFQDAEHTPCSVPASRPCTLICKEKGRGWASTAHTIPAPRLAAAAPWLPPSILQCTSVAAPPPLGSCIGIGSGATMALRPAWLCNGCSGGPYTTEAQWRSSCPSSPAPAPSSLIAACSRIASAGHLTGSQPHLLPSWTMTRWLTEEAGTWLPPLLPRRRRSAHLHKATQCIHAFESKVGLLHGRH